MGTMVVSIDGIHRGSLAGHLGPWRRGGSAQLDVVEPNTASALFALPSVASRSRTMPRIPQLVTTPQFVSAIKSSEGHMVATVSSEPELATISSASVAWRNHSISSSASSTSTSASFLAFTSPQSPSISSDDFSFASCRSPSTPPRGATKRRRPLTDVDGPNTAALSCKKRRLRLELITSRLSQPFSLPATHILNREAVAAGDKRFLKLAAVVAARKLNHPVNFAGAGQGPSPGSGFPAPSQHHPAQSEMLRRAAILNRFRLRICAEAEHRGDKSVVEVAANASLLAGSAGLHGLGFVANARMPSALTTGLRAPDTGPHTPILRLPPAISNPPYPHPLSRAAAVARSSPPGSPSGSPSKALRPADPASLRLPPSPRLSALRSPELKAGRSQIGRAMEEDELDDDNVAFPTSEHESRYDSGDETDDVYADFSVIFGGGSEAESEDEEDRGSDHDHYEDYMDDLDGIPYTLR